MNGPRQLAAGVPNGGSHSDQLMMNASMLFLQQQQQQQQQQAFQGYSHELPAPPPLMRQAPADQGGSAGTAPGAVTPASATSPPSRYESQKRRDWNTFGQYLKNNRPPLPLARCGGEHVLQFLRYLDQFGKTKVHAPRCPYFGLPHPPGSCECPLRQAWGSLDALIGRLRAAFEEHGGKPESNPFGARAVRIYLREVREMQAKARGIAYEKKKRKRQPAPPPASAAGHDHHQQQQQQQQQLAEDPSARNASKAKSELYHQEPEGSSSFLIN